MLTITHILLLRILLLKITKKKNNQLELHQWSNNGKNHTTTVIKFYYMDHNWTLYWIDDKNLKYILMCSTHAYFNPNYEDLVQSRDDIINLLDRNAQKIAYFEDTKSRTVADAPLADAPLADAQLADTLLSDAQLADPAVDELSSR